MDKAPRVPNTPLLYEREDGPWPSFAAGIKRLVETKPMAADLLGQLETSNETRKGYRSGGNVGMFGYGGGIIPRFTEDEVDGVICGAVGRMSLAFAVPVIMRGIYNHG
ncbi:MAG: hypothetical protein ACLPXB_00645 [Thiobacillaceae bacterium]